jgi:hypothetical protein
MTKDKNRSKSLEQEFLNELTTLSHKYQLGIDDGCLFEMDKTNLYGDNIKGYEVDKNGKLLFTEN